MSGLSPKADAGAAVLYRNLNHFQDPCRDSGCYCIVWDIPGYNGSGTHYGIFTYCDTWQYPDRTAYPCIFLDMYRLCHHNPYIPRFMIYRQQARAWSYHHPVIDGDAAQGHHCKIVVDIDISSSVVRISHPQFPADMVATAYLAMHLLLVIFLKHVI